MRKVTGSHAVMNIFKSNRQLVLHLIFFLCLPVQSYAQAESECTILPDYAQEPQAIGNAGCLVIIASKILLVRENFTQKISVPGGTSENNEPARCTASRETHEETGLSVQAGKLLQIFNNNFYLYQCLPLSDVNSEQPVTILVPDEWRFEVSEVLLYDFSLSDIDQWRFPEQYDPLKNIYIGILDKKGPGLN